MAVRAEQRSDPLPRRLLPDNHEVSQGRLSIGGCDLIDLAEAHGTPLFVYDEAHLRSRCREAVAAFGSEVAYAAKAFLCVAMARLAHAEAWTSTWPPAGRCTWRWPRACPLTG